MSRLIDADAITRSTELVKKIVVHDFTPYIKADDLIQFIDKLPTAYNVDKVVEQLEHLLNNFGEHCEDWGRECTHKSCSDCVLSHAIEIVKAGGVE